jgi:hypothetical protein
MITKKTAVNIQKKKQSFVLLRIQFKYGKNKEEQNDNI